MISGTAGTTNAFNPAPLFEPPSLGSSGCGGDGGRTSSSASVASFLVTTGVDIRRPPTNFSLPTSTTGGLFLLLDARGSGGVAAGFLFVRGTGRGAAGFTGGTLGSLNRVRFGFALLVP